MHANLSRIGLIGLVPLLLSGCGAASARTFSATDDESLRNAIASAGPGDRIMLAPGAYAVVQILDRKVDGAPVTISGKDARIAAVGIVRSAGWAFDGLTLGGGYTTRSRVVYIEGSNNISVRNSLIHGLIVNNDPWDDRGAGVHSRFSKGVEIIDNRFRDLGMAFAAGSSSDIRFEGNSIAFVREGTNWVGVKGATIRCNRFSHMFPNWIKDEHPDAMQGWFNKDGGNADFLIEGNFVQTGGPRAIQGIFLAGSYKPEGDPKNRQRNITIRDNIYYGSSQHGISISGVENVVIENNSILPSPHAQRDTPGDRSEDGRRSRGLTPRIAVVGDVSTGRVARNVAVMIVAPPSIEKTDNVIVKRQSQNGKLWSKVFPNPPAGDDPALSAFRAKGEAGARPVCGDRLPEPVAIPSGLDQTMEGWPTS